MLDRGLLRNEPERVRKASSDKGESCPIDRWLSLDGKRRNLLGRTESLRRRRNELSQEVSALKKNGAPADSQIAESKMVGDNLVQIDKELSVIDGEMSETELRFTNIPDPDVPVGKDESDNVLIRTSGEKPSFDFEPKPHWEILGNLFDQEASGDITGANFILLRGWAAWLQRKLINWMMDFHSEAGMEEIWTPFLANRESMTTTGQIPKLEDDMYHIEKDDLFLIPTGEVPLTNIYRNTILSEGDLPVKLFAYTPCFRREAGSYGKDTRGLNRVHQFEKVEMVRFEHPDRSDEALEEMVSHVEKMLGLLELPYRISILATGDLSFAAAKCYDFEVWSTGQEKWLEVSSISNFRDFQSRRGKIRFKPLGGGKPQFVHTLNGSGLALPRIIAALIENNQTKSGKFALPGILSENTEIQVLD
ncbi:MAG: serine--tRNA ligase [Candidatus Fermentibacteraceae bacterium]|nr:serine--tRNA ligase [Candidatus Fermentibacteraceae bacterium]